MAKPSLWLIASSSQAKLTNCVGSYSQKPAAPQGKDTGEKLMQEIQNQSEKLSQQLNQAGAVAFKNLMLALHELSKLDLKPKKKPIEVSKTNSPEAAMNSGFKITSKDSQNPDLTSRQQAERLVQQLNSSLANHKKFNRDVEVNGTKYRVDKYDGGGLNVESKDSKLFAKQGKPTFTGDEEKLTKDLPDIVARMDRELDLERPNQINNRTEVLYGYDSNNKFIDNKLSQKDAQAVLDLMNGKEGTTIAGGENLLIEHDGKKLFETDAQGVVTYSAYERDPKLLSSVKLKDEKGLTELTNYAKRMAATPDNEAKVTKTNEVVIPDPPQEVQKVKPQSPIGKTLDRAEPTTEIDPKQTASVTYDRVLKLEFDKSKSESPQKTIDGVKYKLKPEKEKGTSSVSVKPSESKKAIRIGTVDKDGNFKPEPNLSDPKAIQAMERVLLARGIEAQPLKEAQQLEVAAQSKDPQYLPLTQENAPKPAPNRSSNSPSAEQSLPGVNTAPANTQTVALPAQGNSSPKPKPNITNNSPQTEQNSPGRTPAPANEGVTLPTGGEKGTVTLPTSGGNSERSRPEPEVSQSR
ncbi:hypothetical protein [Chamaesiphon sp.]|uniref:hypothetical protein n=1 Tax=Chamaesiphon sp. TaxID=2814140 RepID=UPI00359449C3